jgi:hypothetical protein
MKKLTLALGLSLLVAACTTPTTARQDAGALDGMASFQDGDDMGPMGDPEMMKAMMAAMMPGDEHRELASRTGLWNVHSQMWMGPDASPITMDTVATSEMILGGRYLTESVKGSFMGQPFEGRLTTGFDNISKEWWSIWIDNMSTSFTTTSGKADKDGTIQMKGTMRDVVTPDGRPYRMVIHPAAEDGSLTTEMFDTSADGTEWKVMSMVYTKKTE